MRNIVACCDFSDVTNAVIESACALATAMNTRLYLLHVVVVETTGVGFESVPMLGESAAEKVHRARNMLNELREPLVKHGLNVSTILLEDHASSVRAIIDEAQRIGADMIVVGSHGHGALYRLLLGSTAEGLLRKAKCPVLVVPSRRPAETKPAPTRTRRRPAGAEA